MTPIEGQPILTAAQMRAAEDAAIAGGATVESLMERAGAAIAEQVRRLASGSEVLILCGPGNNGGDGYVAARVLKTNGVDVRLAALAPPTTDAANAACRGWSEAIETLDDVSASPILVDALFGTGLSRPLDEAITASLSRLVTQARLSIAVDLPSGVATDDGRCLNSVPDFDVTVALCAAKPAHLLYPAAVHCGAVRILDIGVSASSDVSILAKPDLVAPGPQSHKYNRGMVGIIGGAMPGAAELAAVSALRAGAGYALLLTDEIGGHPHAIVRKPWSPNDLDDKRIGAVLIGPGLGRHGEAERRLDHALASAHPLVIDGDALHLLAGDRLNRLVDRDASAILTPHAGEFDALFGRSAASKIDRTRAAAAQSGAIVVFKGPDTVIAAPQGEVRIASGASPWLSSAGTGDVLAGTITALLSSGLDPLDAASAGVWMHGEASRRPGAAFIADDLARELSAVRARL